MDKTFLEERLAAAKAQLLAYDTALSNALEDGVAEYTLDTGQGRQTVQKLSIASLRVGISSLESRIATMCNRLYGTGVTHNRGL